MTITYILQSNFLNKKRWTGSSSFLKNSTNYSVQEGSVRVLSTFGRSTVEVQWYYVWRYMYIESLHINKQAYLGRVRWVRYSFGADAVHMWFARVLLQCGVLTLFCSLLYLLSHGNPEIKISKRQTHKMFPFLIEWHGTRYYIWCCFG